MFKTVLNKLLKKLVDAEETSLFYGFAFVDLILNDVLNSDNIRMPEILVRNDFVTDQLFQFLDLGKSTFRATIKDQLSI